MTTKSNATPDTNAIDTTKFKTAGVNVSYLVQNDILFIAVPVSAAVISAARPSASGKSRTVGSTLGNVLIDGTTVKLGLNAYVPNTVPAH